MRSFNPTPLILPFGILVLAACADSTGTARSAAMTLSFTSRPAASATGAAAGPSLAAAPSDPRTITNGGNTLVITRAQIVLGEIELKQATADCSAEESGRRGSDGSRSGDGGCPEIELDPVAVDLPLDGTSTLDLGVLVPPGTYHEVEFKIENADDDSGPEAALIRAHPELRGASVRVEGTFNGAPFVFTSALEAEIELELATPFVVDADHRLNLTIAVDVASWFTGAGGSLLDPSPASGNAFRIAQNIRASFAAFEDDDRDGVEDHRR